MKYLRYWVDDESLLYCHWFILLVFFTCNLWASWLGLVKEVLSYQTCFNNQCLNFSGTVDVVTADCIQFYYEYLASHTCAIMGTSYTN